MKILILCEFSYLQRKYYDFLVGLEHRSRQILNFLTIKAGFITVPNQQRFLDNQNRKSRHQSSEGRFISFQKVSAFKKNV